MIETRSWKTNYRGEIFIHASLTKDKIDEVRLKKLLSLLPLNYQFKQSKIVCKCVLKDCVYMDKKFLKEIKKNKTEFLCGHYEEGRYAWILEKIEPLEKMINAKGKLGIWNY